jgi:hypothetical protein
LVSLFSLFISSSKFGLFVFLVLDEGIDCLSHLLPAGLTGGCILYTERKWIAGWLCKLPQAMPKTNVIGCSTTKT